MCPYKRAHIVYRLGREDVTCTTCTCMYTYTCTCTSWDLFPIRRSNIVLSYHTLSASKNHPCTNVRLAHVRFEGHSRIQARFAHVRPIIYCTCTYVCMYMYMYMHICRYTTRTCTCIYVYVHNVHVHVHVCIYMAS